MPHTQVAAANEELVDGLLEHVEERTHGRIRRLKVKLDDNRVVLSGHAGSYYLLQLALAAVREVLPADLVDVRIEVGPEPAWPDESDPRRKGREPRATSIVPSPHHPQRIWR